MDRIKVLSRNEKDPDFLRPAADSPLATQGVGKDVKGLPRYVGAAPNAETPRWEWMLDLGD